MFVRKQVEVIIIVVTPYVLSGIVKDVDKSTVLSGVTVTVYNRQTKSSTFDTTDSNGAYVVDLANLVGTEYSTGDNLNVEAVKGNRIKRFNTKVLGVGEETVNFTLEYDDAIGAIIDLLDDNWRNENTDSIKPIIDFIQNHKEQDLSNNDYLLLYEITEIDTPFGIGGSRFEEITGVSVDGRTSFKISSFDKVRKHTFKMREEMKRILKSKISAPVLPFQLLIPRRVKDFSDKTTGIGRFVGDWDLKYWGV